VEDLRDWDMYNGTDPKSLYIITRRAKDNEARDNLVRAFFGFSIPPPPSI